jgi:hypothetical protein
MHSTGYKILWAKIQHDPLWFRSGILEASVNKDAVKNRFFSTLQYLFRKKLLYGGLK